MANLKNLDKVWTAPEGEAVKVGNNRTITRESRGPGRDQVPVFVCRLHGHPVATITPHGASGTLTVRLDACGYLTATTVSAMRDFLAAFGVVGAVSRAGGVLSARFILQGEWVERKSADGESMSFAADRYPGPIA